MKQSLLFALIAWSSLNSTAQISVTSSTFPISGDKMRYAQAANPNVAISLFTPPGGNQNWNLSTLRAASVFESSFRPAIEGTNVANFPGANMVVKEGTTESYYKSSATKLELLGQVSTTIAGINLKATYINQPPIAVRHAPLNFFDIYQQSSSNLLAWAFNQIPVGAINLPVTPDSIRIRISNQIVEVVDAWGTLTLPGSLPQSQYPVLRLKKTTYHEQRIDAKVAPLGWLDVTDNVVRGGTVWSSLFGVDTTVTHHYFNNIEKEEIAVLTFNNAQNAVLSVVYKNTAASTPVAAIYTDSDIQISPNPASEFAFIRITQPVTTKLHFVIYNSLGQIFKSGIINPESISNGFPLDCSHLPSGLYYFKYESKILKGNQRFVVNH